MTVKITSSNAPSLSEIPEYLFAIDVNASLEDLLHSRAFRELLEALRGVDAFSPDLCYQRPQRMRHQAIPLLRQLRTVYAMPLSKMLSLCRQLVDTVADQRTADWEQLTARINRHPDAGICVAKLLLKYDGGDEVVHLLAEMEENDPHAIYPTSAYRTSSGYVSSTEDSSHIEAVMTTSTMTEIHLTTGVLDHDNAILRDIYLPLGRCVCVIDSNVEEHYGRQVEAYFAYHGIELTKLVYRAMEADKGINMVQALLSDFKHVGVSRQEPVLIAGGGVIADTGGLACALYHRSTPYVMLATSIVSGIDAGPSPRTCCDGFGFKNLFGAYHAPVMTLTDPSFFQTLRTGWIRHGIAEIIKMAVVKDEELFRLLEETGLDLIDTCFGTTTDDTQIRDKGQRVLSLAMRNYVASEYPNLYETHQCRPHAYGHTWSPGFEIPSGMLHGHAVACGMGFGAHLSHLQGWLSEAERDRVLHLISSFELSLWHPILHDTPLVYEAQVKITEKRGGNLVAPLPKHGIGRCGYLNELSYDELERALDSYKIVCESYPRKGLGVEAHCLDVGLEDPATIGHYAAVEVDKH